LLDVELLHGHHVSIGQHTLCSVSDPQLARLVAKDYHIQQIMHENMYICFGIVEWSYCTFVSYLVDCSIAALPQLHVFAEVFCGSSKLIVGEDSGLHVKLFKFCGTTLR
jgi:hypothetical protein